MVYKGIKKLPIFICFWVHFVGSFVTAESLNLPRLHLPCKTKFGSLNVDSSWDSSEMRKSLKYKKC